MPQVQFRIINFKLAHQQQSILSTDGQWFKPQGCKKHGQKIEANNWFQVVEFKFPRSQTTRYHMQYISKISKTNIYNKSRSSNSFCYRKSRAITKVPSLPHQEGFTMVLEDQPGSVLAPKATQVWHFFTYVYMEEILHHLGWLNPYK